MEVNASRALVAFLISDADLKVHCWEHCFESVWIGLEWMEWGVRLDTLLCRCMDWIGWNGVFGSEGGVQVLDTLLFKRHCWIVH